MKKTNKFYLVRHTGRWEILPNGRKVIYGRVDKEEIIYANDNLSCVQAKQKELENGNFQVLDKSGEWYSYDVISRKNAKRQGLI